MPPEDAHPPQAAAEAAAAPVESADPLEPFRALPVHLLIHDRDLREQLARIFAVLKFENVTAHPRAKGFLDAARQLGSLLLKNPDGLFLICPPLNVYNAQGRVSQQKTLPDFFGAVHTLMAKVRRLDDTRMSRIVPVFADIEFAHKREQTILSLAEYCVTGAFILKQQPPLSGLPPKLRAERMKEQIMDRYMEIRDYLNDYLPHMDGALDLLMEQKEEQELSKRKAEADAWIAKADQCKLANDFDRAIQCLKKAMELYPQDPQVYLESGRVYVRARKYPNALKRFKQAEDIAENLPEPNKEIANVRVIQATERIERGESPDAPEIVALLDEAVQNYSTALDKAEAIKPLSQDQAQAQEKSSDALARIAGEMFKHDLESLLGPEHPAVQALRARARDALVKVARKSPKDLPPGQLIFLGQAAMDAGHFEDAEKRYRQAAAAPGFFDAACDELCFLGTVVRRRMGPKAALAVYERLLADNPPNRAFALYNMAVAYAVDNDEVHAAGAIVQAVYVDSRLPGNDSFYKNHQIFGPLSHAMDLFEEIVAQAPGAAPDKELRLASTTQDRLESLILERKDKEAAKLLFQAAAKLPFMFTTDRFLASSVAMDYVERKEQAVSRVERPEFKRLQAFLGKIMERAGSREPDQALESYAEHRALAVAALEIGDQALAARHLGVAAAACRHCVLDPEFFTNNNLVNLSREISDKLASVDRERLKG